VDTIQLLRQAVADAHATLERTVADLDQAALDWVPPGTANPIGATLAHVIVSEDMVANAILGGSPPLLRTSFAGRTGLSEPMPMPGPEWAGYADWARRLRVDLPVLLAYARAVWASFDAFLAGLSAQDVEREVDLTFLGRGNRTLGWAVLRMTCAHTDQITGEIAALKGLQGRGGYG
jgi:hypothetical protein